MKNLLFLLFVLTVFVSCDKETGNDKVCASVAGNNLKITNHLSTPVHYFVVERNAAASINWAKTCTEQNKINTNGSVDIALTEIYGYKTDSELVINYWISCDSQDNLKNLVISTKGFNSTCSP